MFTLSNFSLIKNFVFAAEIEGDAKEMGQIILCFCCCKFSFDPAQNLSNSYLLYHY